MPDYVVKTDIITDVDKLHDRIDEVETRNITNWNRIHQEIKTIKDKLYHDVNLVCLSAPQVGFKDRFFCIKFAHGDIRTFINPIIINNKGLHLSREKSESIPGKEYIVPRHNEINVVYTKSTGHVEENQFNGVVAEVFEQMLQMLDGVLISDFGLEVLPGFDDLSNEDKEKIILMYLDSLKKADASLQDEIKNDKDLQDFNTSIDFMKSLTLGTVNVKEMTEEEKNLFKKVRAEKAKEKEQKEKEKEECNLNSTKK